jgi:hypothetical protein
MKKVIDDTAALEVQEANLMEVVEAETKRFDDAKSPEAIEPADSARVMALAEKENLDKFIADQTEFSKGGTFALFSAPKKTDFNARLAEAQANLVNVNARLAAM